MRQACLTALIAILIGRAGCVSLAAAPSPKWDLVVVGTGISGLAAALDAGRAGANVTVIDMWSVFGGHAVMSSGLVCLVD
ncbi:MAG: FAD-binding protein, partial [Verrucomicrobiales bacterium]|nr:FAD-binding protein [Verrucomicrobiales bacterium]